MKEMAITTHHFSLTPVRYFKIILANRLKRYWWVYGVSILLAILHLSEFGEDRFATFVVIFGFVYPFFVFTYLYIWASSKKNRLFLLSRQLVIDDDKITAFIEDETKTEFPLRYVLKVVSRKRYWMLYIAQGQFIYIPKTAFKSPEDLRDFKEIVETLPES